MSATDVTLCAAHSKTGVPCRNRALPFTINHTCRRHHRAVRAWAAKRAWRVDTRTTAGVPGTSTPYGIVDTWGSPTVAA